jgi:dTDP-4-dehydrorhamnose reductase
VFENPVYNIQCAEVLWAMTQKRARGITHIAGGEMINRYDFGLKTAEVFGFDKSLISAVDSSFFPAIAPRPKNTSFNTHKMFRESGIKPLSVTEGLMLMKQEAQE